MTKKLSSEVEQIEPLNLISLEANNVKVLRAVRIEPETRQPIYSIGGRNGAGKSSILRCIQMSFQGGRAIPEDPIRHGEHHANIKTVVGRDGKPVFTIELDMTVAKKPRLVVKNAENQPVSSPQDLLNKLYEHVGFDPLEFSRFDKEKQADIIMRLADLDFSDDDIEYNIAFENRKTEKKLLSETDAKLKGMVEHRGVPAEEKSIKEVLETLSTARAHNEARVNARTKVGEATGKITAGNQLIATLEQELADARAALSARQQDLKQAEAAFAELAPAKDVAALELEASTLEETNKKVRHNIDRAKHLKAVQELELKVAKQDRKLEDVTARKKAKIAAAKFPIPELRYDITSGLLLNNAPLKEASDGQKLRLSVAIAIALNPTLKILLIKQGNLLDAAATKMITEMATEAGAQVFMEMVSEDGAGCTVYIEDGEIKEPAAAAAE